MVQQIAKPPSSKQANCHRSRQHEGNLHQLFRFHQTGKAAGEPAARLGRRIESIEWHSGVSFRIQCEARCGYTFLLGISVLRNYVMPGQWKEAPCSIQSLSAVFSSCAKENW